MDYFPKFFFGAIFCIAILGQRGELRVRGRRSMRNLHLRMTADEPDWTQGDGPVAQMAPAVNQHGTTLRATRHRYGKRTTTSARL